MGTESGADVRGVVVVQTVRVLLLAVGIPLGFAIAGIEGGTAIKPAEEIDTTLPELAILVAVSVASALAMYKIGFSGGLLFGAMIGAAALNGSGLVEARLPWWLANGAMIAMGAVTGSRLARIDLNLLVSYLLAALGSFTAAAAVASCFVLLAASLVGARPADLVVAFSPGAQDTMMLLALALHLDPVFVGAHHLARYGIASVGVTPAANVLSRRMKTNTSPLEGESLPSGSDPRVERTEGAPGEGGTATSSDKSALPPSPQPSPIKGEGDAH